MLFVVVAVSYEIMLRCWELEPAKRLTFTVVKATMDNFMKNDHSRIIHFPDPDSAYNSSLSDGYYSASPFTTPPPGYDALIPAEDVVKDDLFSVEQDFLEVRARVRRHRSEPGFEAREEGSELESNEDSGGGNLRRSHSNPYVGTPKRDSKLSTRKSFEWMFEAPQIRIESISEI